MSGNPSPTTNGEVSPGPSPRTSNDATALPSAALLAQEQSSERGAGAPLPSGSLSLRRELPGTALASRPAIGDSQIPDALTTALIGLPRFDRRLEFRVIDRTPHSHASEGRPGGPFRGRGEAVPPATVLLVDDSRDDCIINTRLIRRHWGPACEVVVAGDGGQAIDRLLERASADAPAFELIFLDVNMPRVDAWGFLELYAGLPAAAHADQLALMVATELPVTIERRAKGSPFISLFVAKPLDFASIDAELAALAERFNPRVNGARTSWR